MVNMTKKTDKFDESALTWDADEGRRKTAKTVADNIRKQIPLTDSMKAMDFGSGTGLVTFFLLNVLNHVTAVDLSPAMLQQLNNKVKAQRIGSVQPLLLKDEDSELPGDKYDLIYSSMTMHHVKNYQRTIRQFYDRLKANGYLAIADLFTEQGDFHSDANIVEHYGFDPQELKQVLVDTGFQSISYSTIHHITKTTHEGVTKQFPVFLITAHKVNKHRGFHE
ncbi:MAG: methyltransferase [Caldithrix sp.]|nr:methyltransferase [Caldithrix sp.]